MGSLSFLWDVLRIEVSVDCLILRKNDFFHKHHYGFNPERSSREIPASKEAALRHQAYPSHLQIYMNRESRQFVRNLCFFRQFQMCILNQS